MSESLAAELLADFDDEENEEQTSDNERDSPFEQNGLVRNRSKSTDFSMELDGDEEGDEEDEDADMGGMGISGADLDADDDAEARKSKVEKLQLGGVEDVRSVAGLMKVLEPVLEQIKHYQSLPPNQQQHVGSIEDNPEYKLLVSSNAHSVEIDNEIILVHKFIRDHYSVRFPELENLVTNPLDYAKTVSIIGNNMDIKAIEAQTNNRLRSFLDGPTLMVVTVEATTTSGRPLTDKELSIVMRACEMTLALDNAKKIITDYVQSRMALFAPNTTAIIGSQTAAQLINFAGGLTGLAKTPACNLAALGAKRQTQTGFATNVGVRQQGYLYHSPIIKNIPSNLKKQAMRIVSAKIVLAARIDRVHEHPDGSMGQELRRQCLQRLEKLTEPPSSKGPRALPAPDDKPSRKRGGRRARKAKEATAMTELRKAQNRMAFGKEEAEVGYGYGESTKGLGMIGQEQNGRIRAVQIDQRTRAKLGKNKVGWGAATPVGGAQSILKGYGPQTGGGLASLGIAGGAGKSAIGGGGSGMASTLAFTPVQGIELVDPKLAAERKRKMKAEEDRYFAGGTFSMVGPNAGSAGSMAPPPLKKAKTEVMAPPPLPKK
ncbi:hypothetical protein BDZ91DRAFT_680050 [Kalaharituber pfeilii]|nr:hypothetical protein BDZ91DRAFT_680050 [Kalaharituber pfeilii]